jgi:hypothetical protein
MAKCITRNLYRIPLPSIARRRAVQRTSRRIHDALARKDQAYDVPTVQERAGWLF